MLTFPSNNMVRHLAGHSARKGYNYDGSNDWGSRSSNLTGIADGKAGTLSIWFKQDVTTTARYLFTTLNGGNGFDFMRESANNIRVRAYNAAGTIILNFYSTETIPDTTNWHHFVASWDLATTTLQVYMNDVAMTASSPTITNDTIDYTKGKWGFCATDFGNNKMDGKVSQFLFHTTHIDLSVTANRRKFISADKKPVSFGAQGKAPLGVQPLVFFPDGDPSNNQGSGGTFTLNGALDLVAGPGA